MPSGAWFWTATCYTLLHLVTLCYTLLHLVTPCYTLLHLVTPCYTLLHLVKVWEAVAILRAQSKTIMSLDEVQLQETSTGRSVRSGHSGGGGSTSRSPTISIAQSRLSNRDDSIRVSRESVNVKFTYLSYSSPVGHKATITFLHSVLTVAVARRDPHILQSLVVLASFFRVASILWEHWGCFFRHTQDVF